MTKATDVDALAAIHAAAFAGSPMRPWHADEIAALLGTPGTTVFIDDPATPAGFVIVRQVLDEAEVLTLAVVPGSRRRGIGRRLMRQAVDMVQAMGGTRLFLDVAAGNAAARRLYVGLGFVESGLRRGYYRSDGVDDAVLMVKVLSA